MTFITQKDKKDDDVADDDGGDGELTFDQTPVRVVCPHCGLSVITFIEHESSWVTYTISIILLLVLNWAALCVVPVVFPLFKDVVHHCPRCLSILATRSRVAVSSFQQEVMSFRFGSCVIVLARKYVIMLIALTALIGGIHLMRSPRVSSSGLDAIERSELSPLAWEDFMKDCGFKSYLGNPIHVTMAFKQQYKNKTFHWQGSVHHVESGLNLLFWTQRGAIYVSMTPPQFPAKRDVPDLVLLYKEDDKLGAAVQKLKKGAQFSFDATMAEVGRRGAPHVMLAWEVALLPDAPPLGGRAGDPPAPARAAQNETAGGAEP